MKKIGMILSLVLGMSAFAGGDIFHTVRDGNFDFLGVFLEGNAIFNDQVILSEARISFQTTEEGLDGTTKVETIIKCGEVMVAQLSLINNPLGVWELSPFIRIPIINSVEKKNFFGDLCSIRVIKTPNGLDIWTFEFELSLKFSDGTKYNYTSLGEAGCPYGKGCVEGEMIFGPYGI